MTRPRRLDPLRLLALRPMLLGRRVVMRLDDRRLALTVTRFESRLDVVGLAFGVLPEVRVAACDIRWNGMTFDHATAVARNVRLRPSAPPALVAAPVELTLDITSEALGDVFGWAAPRLAGAVSADGVARLQLARRPSLGHVEVDVGLDGSTLRLRPRSVALGRWRLPIRTPAYPVRLPALPHGLQLTGIALAPGRVRLFARIPEWRFRTGLF